MEGMNKRIILVGAGAFNLAHTVASASAQIEFALEDYRIAAENITLNLQSSVRTLEKYDQGSIPNFAKVKFDPKKHRKESGSKFF